MSEAIMNELPKAIASLSPSENASRVFLSLARQIARRDEISEEQVFQDEVIVGICSREKLGRKDKLKLIRKQLEEARFPLRTKIEKALEDSRKQLVNDLGLKIQLPEDLEGDAITIQLSARSTVELLSQAKQVEKLSTHPEAKKIFEILTGSTEFDQL